MAASGRAENNRTKSADRGTLQSITAEIFQTREKPCRNSIRAQSTPMNAPNTEEIPPPGPDCARRRVLVVESDRLIRALIVEWLGMAGNDTLCVADLADVKALAERFDVVLADVPAPHRAARGTVMQLAQAIPHVPIIAMSADITAVGVTAREALARELGACAVLVKPFNQQALLSAIHQFRA
jgi:CheY-like chemotaxis protein